MDKKNFEKPNIIGIIGDANTGKSNLIHFLIDQLKSIGKFNLYYYGLDLEHVKDSIQINSVEELEQIKDSIIIIDEVMSMWDLDNRNDKKLIEKSLRLIFHNNNVLILSFLPENVKKFIASKIKLLFLKKITLEDFIRGTKTKRITMNYKGVERGSHVLNIPVDRAIYFDGEHYRIMKIPYMEKYDTKKKNKPIIKEHKKEVKKK